MNTKRDWVLEKKPYGSDTWTISLYAGKPELFWSELTAQDAVDERNMINYQNCEWRVCYDF